MVGVPKSVIFLSMSLYNEQEKPGQARDVPLVDCNHSCRETCYAPKRLKHDLVAVYD